MKPRPKPLQGILLFLLVVGALSSCQRLPVVPGDGKPAVASAQALRDQILARSQAIRSFKAKGQLSVLSPQKNYNGSALLFGSKPETVRLDVLNFWGQPALTFLTDGQEVKMLAYSEAKLYKGPATSHNLAVFIPPPVKVQELVEVLTGGVPLGTDDEARLTDVPGADQYRLEISPASRQGRVDLLVDAKTGQILKALWFDAQGKQLFAAEFSDFDSRGSISFPLQVILTTGDNQSQVRIRYRDFSLNPPATSETLVLPITTGIQELPFAP
jgi:hypothetical protein